jgi:hypothetical protein
MGRDLQVPLALQYASRKVRTRVLSRGDKTSDDAMIDRFLIDPQGAVRGRHISDRPFVIQHCNRDGAT